MKTFDLRVIKPERLIFEGKAISVRFPTSDGQIQIFATHEPIIGKAGIGELMVEAVDAKGNKIELPFAIAGGFFEMSNDNMTILAGRAEHVRELDVARAKEARLRARQLLEEAKEKTPAYEGLVREFNKESNRVTLAERYGKK
ncbi:MAG: ATP synthase F1 subunit epsilon [Candidatus Vogelbacteria bacterium CG10_big_fil_rev_8_21_14_0_10_45_14]|uniref:ATP synthase epsilon chain n=1 Tax=Candidatus Vogelbacteria bacterium CG10_big_fil_rev_8_21_14_0_10_45_14 TaxID=1975042 RepID=A0A2H0RL42_9BACT|nr:MAG: ATP synthase F1 subunit epsilon [Candidatus Vogelbacteria bacterium CG10_big_fil_rev_8_21_14_0_10_45_14]